MRTVKERGVERSIQSVDRAVAIIKYIASKRNAAPLTDISAGVGLSNSTAHGLLAALKRGGLVEQDDDTRKYSLGIGVFELGQAVYRQMDIHNIALPYLRQLVEKYRETCQLAILSEGEIVYIEKVESPRSIRMISSVGARHPAHCTGLGKVLLAGLSDRELSDFLKRKPLARYTTKTITDPEKLRKEIEGVRRNGYSLDREEIEDGLRCVAAPIRNDKGHTVAALSISMPANRLRPEDLPHIIADIKGAAGEISRKLGHPG
jgi:DNA-binding IclR family transcriptional regulator